MIVSPWWVRSLGTRFAFGGWTVGWLVGRLLITREPTDCLVAILRADRGSYPSAGPAVARSASVQGASPLRACQQLTSAFWRTRASRHTARGPARPHGRRGSESMDQAGSCLHSADRCPGQPAADVLLRWRDVPPCDYQRVAGRAGVLR